MYIIYILHIYIYLHMYVIRIKEISCWLIFPILRQHSKCRIINFHTPIYKSHTVLWHNPWNSFKLIQHSKCRLTMIFTMSWPTPVWLYVAQMCEYWNFIHGNECISNACSLHTYIKPSLHQTCPRQIQKLTISSGDSVNTNQSWRKQWLEVLTEFSLESLAYGACVSSCQFVFSIQRCTKKNMCFCPLQTCLFARQSVVLLLSKVAKPETPRPLSVSLADEPTVLVIPSHDRNEHVWI